MAQLVWPVSLLSLSTAAFSGIVMVSLRVKLAAPLEDEELLEELEEDELLEVAPVAPLPDEPLSPPPPPQALSRPRQIARLSA